MKILLAAATSGEIGVAADWIRYHQPDTGVLITGVGAAAAAHALTRSIYRDAPALIIQAGIGGSFSTQLPPGSVALIGDEVFADLGVAEPDGFRDIFDLNLMAPDDAPFEDRKLPNPDIASWRHHNFPVVSGATVNRISCAPEEIRELSAKYGVLVESMEGAALHYVGLKEGVRFLQIRSISNYTGERDKTKWLMRESIERVNEAVIGLLKALGNTGPAENIISGNKNT